MGVHSYAAVVVTTSTGPVNGPVAVRAGQTLALRSDTPVTWSLSPGSQGSIGPDGVYRAPNVVAAKQSYVGCPVLPNAHVFNSRIDNLPVHPNSSTWINDSKVGLGGQYLKYSQAFPVNLVDSSTPSVSLSFLYSRVNNGTFSIPAFPALRIENGYWTWTVNDNDRHAVMLNTQTCVVQEIYNLYPAGFNLGCPTCTSQSGVQYSAAESALSKAATDAAGLFLLPLTFRIDEIRAGAINHALRFTIDRPSPNFIWPAIASAGYPNEATRMRMGARVRLKASFNTSGLSPLAQVLATQLKQYGLILADRGLNWDITGVQEALPDDVRAAFQEIGSKVSADAMEVVDESSLMFDRSMGLTKQTDTVIATNTANPADTAVVRIALRGAAVSLGSTAEAIQAGSAPVQLRAWLNEGSVNTGITWTMTTSVGTLTSDGLYTPPPSVPSPVTTTMRATSTADATVFTTMRITVLPAGVIRINSGDATDYVDPSGNTWWGDTTTNRYMGIESGYSYNHGPGWSNTTTPELYTNSRTAYADLVYSFVVPNGTYTVAYKIGENESGANLRRINLDVQGQTAYTNLDVFTAAGGSFRAMDFTVPATVVDGKLKIAVRSRGVAPGYANSCCSVPIENSGYTPQIMAMQITPNSVFPTTPAPTPVPPPVPTPVPTTPSSTSASFVGTDDHTGGSWVGTYGAGGAIKPLENSYLSGELTWSSSNMSSYSWAPGTQETRALQTISNPANRTATTWFSTTSFSLRLNIPSGQQNRVALYMMDWDRLNRQQKVEVLSVATGAVLDSQTADTFATGKYLVWNVVGPVEFRITNTGPVNAVIGGIFLDPVAAATATFVNTDTQTKGNWFSSGLYGSKGVVKPLETPKLPTITWSSTNATAYTWAAATADKRALQTIANPSVRSATTWYSASTFSLRVNMAEGQQQRVALYIMDWDAMNRNEKIEVVNVATGAVVDTRTVQSFAAGVYLMWNVTGSVEFRVTNTGPMNAIVEGVFIDPPQASSATGPVTFLGTDTQTQGNWSSSGLYGRSGVVKPAEAPKLPVGAAVTVSNTASSYRWESLTFDARALQTLANPSVRSATTWFSTTSMTFSVTAAVGQQQRVALYMMDWDSLGRKQRIDVVNVSTGAILDTHTVESFSAGVYLTWQITGSVNFRVTNIGPVNAIVEGLFLD